MFRPPVRQSSWCSTIIFTKYKQTDKLMLQKLAQILEICTVTSSGFIYAIWQFVYVLLVLLQSTLMVVAEAAETCRRLIIYVKSYFTNVYLLFHYSLHQYKHCSNARIRIILSSPCRHSEFAASVHNPHYLSYINVMLWAG